MKRKLVKQGAATLMVSLPSKWAKQNKLGKGDEVDVFQRDNALMLTPESVSSKREVEIEIGSETESSVRTIITNTYRMGYDRIKVYFNSTKNKIKDVYLEGEAKIVYKGSCSMASYG